MTKSIWNGYERIDFLFEGREAILVFPGEANEERNWLFKTEYFGAFPSFEVEMLGRGWHLAYIKNQNRWCLDADLELKDRFAEYLTREYGLNKKCVPVGMSCGGMFAVKLAAKYPERIGALYLDAPVMNRLSCPAALGSAKPGMLDEFYKATGISLKELLSYRDHPIDKMDTLLKNSLPVAIVYGDSDEIVPYDENGALLEKYYKENGGTLFTFGKKGCGHHPHGLENNSELIKFIEMHTK